MTNDSKSDSKKKSRYQLGCVASIGSLLLVLAGSCNTMIFVYSKLFDEPANKMNTGGYLCCLLPLLLIGGALFFFGIRSFMCAIGSHQWREWSYITKDKESIANACEMERMCNYCQKHETRQEQPHSWNEWTYISDGSCNQERSCNLCQIKESRKANHDWDDWKYKPNSCEQERECKHCHQRDAKAAIHDWEDWKYKPNSCEQERECKHCHQHDAKTAVHDWEDWKYQPSSCEQDRECRRCHQRDAKTAIHDWGKWTKSDLSGDDERLCQRCKEREISHNHRWVTISRTEIETVQDDYYGGWITRYKMCYKCAKCGVVKYEEGI